MTKIKTIKLNDGTEYAMVKDRIKAMHQENKRCSVTSTYEASDKYVVFCAEVETEKGVFTGHAFTREVKDIKNFEKHECMPLTTEILTRGGFKFYHEVSVGEEVLSFRPDTQEMVWAKVKKISTFKNSPLVRISSQKFNAVCTPDHKWVFEDYKGRTELIPLDEINLDSLSGKIKLAHPEQAQTHGGHVDDAARLGWLFTDGVVRYTKSGLPTSSYVQQSKKETVAILVSLFGEPTSSTEHERWLESFIWHISADETRRILGKYKVRESSDIPRAVCHMDIAEVEEFLNAALQADGWNNKTGNSCYFAKTDKQVVESVQIAATRLGIRTSKIKERLMQKSTKPVYQISLYSTQSAYVSQLKVTKIPPADTWCPTIENTGTWVARQSGQVWITGNTYAIGRALAFAGYLTDGGIASSEELQDYNEEVDDKIEETITDINKKRSEKTLGRLWLNLPEKYRRNEKIMEAYQDKKNKLGVTN